jgi:hypothetical protein
LKDEVYNSDPQMEEELKGNVHGEISNILAEELQRGKSEPLLLV